MNDNKVEDVTDLVRADGTFGRIRPTFEFMKPRLSRWIAFGLGSGLSNVVPGTMGTLFAWVAFAILAPLLGGTGRDVGVHDHSAIVWDEIVAFWLVLWVIPQDFSDQLVGFLLFRLFDITKPAPIRTIDSQWQNAIGVLLDDLLAAAYTVIVMAVWERLFD